MNDMKKKKYIMPSTEVDNCFVITPYMAGDNSVPWGGDDGPGIAEGKERNDEDKEDSSWGNLW